MDSSIILDQLNEAQRQAVTAPLCHQLVLAGAGSGKTRVLVHRIAWLIQMENLFPSSILAVTFTNKAANEMRSRIEKLLNMSTRSMWVGTFHSISHRLLRMHFHDANLPGNFQVLDSDDQHRLIRRLTRELNLDEDQWAPKKTQWFINGRKDAGQRAKDINPNDDLYLKTVLRVYQAYESACEQRGLVDFTELLLRSYELLKNNANLLQHYQQRFKHILVDEFQDTNTIQYKWLKLLVNDNNHMTIVGDDDQSIYGWRGARVENIRQILKDLPNTRTIRLEQNYRSSGNILAAANALINHNAGRMGKNLWTTGSEEEKISVYGAFNELDEARYIVEIVKNWITPCDQGDQGNRRDEAAILYRSNAQSRVLEEAFIMEGIPYRIYGGLRFFERAEIKDALAYLRLLVNRHNDASFERVVNMPTRGIGNTTMTVLRDYSRENKKSLWQSAQEILTTTILSSRAKSAISHFLDIITTLAEETKEFDLALQTKQMIEKSGLLNHYRKEKGEKGRARVENLEELITAAGHFCPQDAFELCFEDNSQGALDDSLEDATMPLLQAFLSHAALEAGESQGSDFDDCVQMMTLHSAKGLEFPLVIVSGMEEGLFPHKMSLEEQGRLEEERRLCYVGLTRAKQKLYLTYAESRRLYGREDYHRPSRFISEIPEKYLAEVRLKSKVSRPVTNSKYRNTELAKYRDPEFDFNRDFNQDIHFDNDCNSRFNIGDIVTHPKFGEGVVLAREGSGDNARINVKFSRADPKWLIASFLT